MPPVPGSSRAPSAKTNVPDVADVVSESGVRIAFLDVHVKDIGNESHALTIYQPATRTPSASVRK